MGAYLVEGCVCYGGEVVVVLGGVFVLECCDTCVVGFFYELFGWSLVHFCNIGAFD